MNSRVISLLIASVGLCCVSANQHLQTTANPNTLDFVIDLPDEKILVNLEMAGTEVVKYPNGKLKELHFTVSLTKYAVYFWPDWNHGKEQVRYLQTFEVFEGGFVPHGEWLSFSSTGTQLTRQNWSFGKLHGIQQTFNQMGILVSEFYYDKGFPVGTWTHWYVEGNKAREMTYPKSADLWKETMRAQSFQNRKKGSTTFNHQLAKEIWFSPSGNKIKEINYRLFVESDGSFQQERWGETLTYGEEGKILHKSSVIQGTGKVESYAETPARHKIQESWYLGKKRDAIIYPYPE